MKVSVCFFLGLIFGVIFELDICLAQSLQGQDLRFLLDDNAELRIKLESRVQALHQRAASLRSDVDSCTCPPPATRPPKSQVAYTGTLVDSVLSSLSTSYIFNFTGDLVNVGDPYVHRYARFIAPVSGVYGFHLTAYIGTTGRIISLEIIQDGSSISYVRTGHYSNRQYAIATNYVIVNMTAGTELWPRYESGSGYLYGEGITSFGGVLLQEF